MEPEFSLSGQQGPGTYTYYYSYLSRPVLDTPSYSIKILFTIIFLSTSRLSKWLFSSRYPKQNPICIYFSLHVPHAPPPKKNCSLFISITKQYLARKASHQSPIHSLQPPVTYFILVPNFIISTLFSNILSQYSSLSAKRQVLKPHKTTAIVQFCFNFYVFGQNKWGKIFWNKWQQEFP